MRINWMNVAKVVGIMLAGAAVLAVVILVG